MYNYESMKNKKYIIKAKKDCQMKIEYILNS
jgi:hypothetical protein